MRQNSKNRARRKAALLTRSSSSGSGSSRSRLAAAFALASATGDRPWPSPKSSSGRKLLEVAEDLVFHADEIESLKQALLDRRGSRFGVPDLDRERVTRREGDTRVVAG